MMTKPMMYDTAETASLVVVYATLEAIANMKPKKKRTATAIAPNTVVILINVFGATSYNLILSLLCRSLLL